MIPVAILGSDAFDVFDVNATTLVFADGAAPVHKRGGHPQDVNGDGLVSRSPRSEFRPAHSVSKAADGNFERWRRESA